MISISSRRAKTRELDHVRDGQCCGHDQHQHDHQPDTAQEHNRRGYPLDPGLVEPHLLDPAHTLQYASEALHGGYVTDVRIQTHLE